MNSRKGGGKGFYAAAGSSNGVSSSRMNNMEGSGSSQGSQNLDQLNRAIADVSIDPAQDGGWEVIGKKSKNRTGLGAQKSVGSGGSNWPQGNDPRRPVGWGNPRPQTPNKSYEAPYMAPPAIRPPLPHAWQWEARGGSQHINEEENISTVPNDGSVGGYGSESDTETKQPESEDDDLAEESDDDDLGEDYDSDASQLSLETQKKNRWFKDFFKTLDGLTVDELNEQSRQWHCPACHNDPGAIDWYKGLQPLVAHAKTKGATRVKLHRELAEVLEEELQRRGSF